MAGEDTFPKLMLRRYELWGNTRVAYRHKDFGYWREFTWQDYYEAVKHFALGLASLGFERGDKISICGENAPEWFWGQLAAESIGGVSVGLYVDSIPSELQFIIDHSDSKVVLVDDQEQVDKILAIREQIPKVKKVVYWRAKGMWAYEEPWLIGFDEVVKLGRDYEREHPGFFEESIEKGSGDDQAVYLYTSGTTGLPKGSILSYSNLLGVFRGWDAAIPWYESDQNVSYLPPAWVGEQVSTVLPNLAKGICINFVEQPETVIEDIREIGPEVLIFSARQWEMYCSIVQAKMIDSSWAKKLMYGLFLPAGYKVTDLEAARETVNLFWRALSYLGYLVVFRALRDKLGLLKLRFPLTAGAALSPDNFRFLRAIGVRIRQGYGTTEVSGLNTVQLKAEDFYFESSGSPLPGTEIRISDEGEILIGGEGLCVGYYKRPDESDKAFAGGYFHSGDAGYIDEEGHLYILDRIPDMMTLKTGDKFSPTYIEGKLKFSPYVKDAMAIGGGDKDYVTCIVDMDYENVGRWAERNHIVYTSHPDLSQKPEVLDLIDKDLARINRTLPEPVRVKRFLVLHKNFDPDEAELTRTRKLRRAFVEDRYKLLISAMYGGEDKVDVESTITYRDGRKSIMRIPVRIESVA